MRLLLVVMALLVAGTLLGAAQGWAKLDWNIGLHGWIALSLAVVLSFALGGGLMALSFYSSRRGYDDRVQPFHPDSDSEPPADR